METDKEQSILTEAQGLVHGDRNADYGHPLDDFSRTAAIWTALLGGKLKDGAHIEPEDVGLCMVGVKLSRQINQPKRDNLTDAAGYCETVRMVIDEKERRANPVFVTNGSDRVTGPLKAFPSSPENWSVVRASDGIVTGVGSTVAAPTFVSAAKREGTGST